METTGEHLEPIIYKIPRPAGEIILEKGPNYQIDIANKLKSKLNSTKSQLDEFYLSPNKDKLEEFMVKRRITNKLRSLVRNKYDGQYVSRAWLKFYEIFQTFNTIDKSSYIGQLHAFMNAEFPGTALLALNHLMKTLYAKIKFRWHASSIISSDAGASFLEDAYGLYTMNSLNWIMSSKYNGDMTNVDVLLHYENLFKNSIDLNTHDAGIDVTAEQTGADGKKVTVFNQQEEMNARIHLGCALCGLMTLRTGGCAVWKQYTLFETLSINLIVLYASLFEEFYLMKPITSGANNSEIYLVGINFLGLNNKDKDFLLNKLEHFDMSPIISEDNFYKNKDTIDAIFKFIEKRTNDQIAAINAGINLFNKYLESESVIDKVREEESVFTNEWLKKNKIERINRRFWLKSKAK